MELTAKTFFNHLIFHPEDAKIEDKKKCLVISIALGCLSFGIIPLVVGTFWGMNKAITWISSHYSHQAQKTDNVASNVLTKRNPARSRLKKLTTNPSRKIDIDQLLSEAKVKSTPVYQIEMLKDTQRLLDKVLFDSSSLNLPSYPEPISESHPPKKTLLTAPLMQGHLNDNSEVLLFLANPLQFDIDGMQMNINGRVLPTEEIVILDKNHPLEKSNPSSMLRQLYVSQNQQGKRFYYISDLKRVSTK